MIISQNFVNNIQIKISKEKKKKLKTSSENYVWTNKISLHFYINIDSNEN